MPTTSGTGSGSATDWLRDSRRRPAEKDLLDERYCEASFLVLRHAPHAEAGGSASTCAGPALAAKACPAARCDASTAAAPL